MQLRGIEPMKLNLIFALLILVGIVFAAGALASDSVQSVMQLAAASAKENGTIAGQAVCADYVNVLKTSIVYDQCLDVVDAQVEPQSREVVVQAYRLAAYHSDQEVYAFCDDNVDRLTRKGYAACYTYGSDAPRSARTAP
jgi:uncharacterized membrane protein YjgN (DUF898 family)